MTESFKNCPHCAELVLTEAIICRFCDRGISKENFKDCPHCTEMIWNDAKYCRFCKSTVGNNIDWGAMFKTDRKTIFDQIKAGTGIHLDDEAIEKIFEQLLKRAD